MRANALLFPALLFVMLWGAAVNADTLVASDTLGVDYSEAHLLAPETHRLQLRHGLIVPGSLRAMVGGEEWLPGADYRVDERTGVWLPLRALGGREGGNVLVVLSYRHPGVAIPLRRDLHPLRTRPLKIDQQQLAPTEYSTQVAGDEMSVPGDLLVRGSKTVRMASGNRRELVVDQNLRLNISGHLTEDIRVQAVLSDDNLPVVPEGNTEELRDIDRVRVDVTAPNWRAVLGDFVASRRDTRLGGYRRKLQGAQVETGGGRFHSSALAGSPRGRFRTVNIRGEEANQGPYSLGSGGAEQLFVVAGSERVYLDGERATRGADRDYVIDYVRGTVTFTYRKLITAESEIVMEYEEGEGPYSRTVAAVGAGVHGELPGLGVQARLQFGMIREQDDPDRPRNGELSDADQTVLAEAGDDESAAVASGWTAVAVGEGQYRREEIGGLDVAVWDSLNGDYDVQFFQIGSGLGDYTIDSLTETGATVYLYAGAGGGSWKLGRALELPEQHSLMTMAVSFGDTVRPWLDSEWHVSRRDLNSLSGIGDDDDEATAWRANLTTGKRDLRLRGLGLGRAALRVEHEKLGAGFSPFVRLRDPFRYERWGLGSRARREGFLEESDQESRAEAIWELGDQSQGLVFEADWGQLRHGAALKASEVAGRLAWDAMGLHGQHEVQRATAEDTVDPLDVDRQRDVHLIKVVTGSIRPSLEFLHEEAKDGAASDFVAAGSRLERLRWGLGGNPTGAWAWQLAWTVDRADSLRAGQWQQERNGRMVDWKLGTPRVQGVQLTADGIWREVEFPEGEDRTSRLAKIRLTGRWERLGSDWDLVYGVDNSRAEVLDRQVIYIGERQGDYNQAGDFVGLNLGDFQVVTVGTDSLVATTEVKADLTWRQDFGFFGRERVWGGWNTLTRVALRGRSRTDDVGGLLRLERDRLLDEDDGVLGEVAFRQEANLLRHLRDWDLRLIYDRNEILDRQYAAHPEQRIRQRHETVLANNPTEQSTLRWRSRRELDRRLTEESALSSNRSYDSVGWRHEAEAQWRPAPGNQLAVAVDLVRRNDTVTGVVQREWGLKPSSRWRMGKRWSGLMELRWSRVESDEPDGVLRPFFFSYPGDNVDMTTRLTWNPSPKLTIGLAQSSRRLGAQRGWRHDVRLESTARF